MIAAADGRRPLHHFFHCGRHRNSWVGELSAPPLSRIIPLPFVRGALLVPVCLPLLHAWRGSTQRFVLTLGLSLWVLIGLLFMITGHWLPSLLRVVHGVELLVDALAFAGLLALLFRRSGLA